MPAGLADANLPGTLHELLERQARARPDQEFVRSDGRVWTYRQLDQHARMVARALSRRGIGRGDRVLLMMQSSESYLALWFGISRLGAVEVPVNAAYRGEILRHILRTAAAKVALVAREYREQFEQPAQGLFAAGDIIDPQCDELVWNEAQAAALTETHLDVEVLASDPACVVFTSGTTGLSKGVVMSHRHQITFGRSFSEVVELAATDVAYNFLPFFHVAAKFLAIGAMLAGARMIMRPVFSASHFWRDVREGQATLCIAVGGLCHILNSAPPAVDDADNPLRLIYSVPVPWEFKESFEARFGLRLIEAYGRTESNLNICCHLNEETPRGSCGRASPHFDVSIRDENGVEVPRGVAGEIWVRAKEPNTTMIGYLGPPELTAETMHGAWLKSGDRAHVDERGYFYFVDRIKDAIRRRGENISSVEVERVLNAHPSVAEVAVVPVKAEVGEDEVKAVVILKPGASLAPEALLEFAVQSLPYFMVPRFIEFKADLPRTPTMRVKKDELREEGRTQATWDCEKAGLRITRRGLERIMANGSSAHG